MNADSRIQIEFPAVGQRIIRTVIGIFLCYVIYYIRGQRGMPFYSVLAVLQCIQPYMSSSFEMGKQRTIGTMIGAGWGLIVIILAIRVFHVNLLGNLIGYLLISVFTGVVLYSTVVLQYKAISGFSAVVFLSIVVNHLNDNGVLLYVVSRVIDTMIGVLVAIAINAAHMPRIKHQNVLYLSELDDAMLGDRKKLTPYSKIQLNHMIEHGMKFSISTWRTPASLMEFVEGVQLNIPVIVMNGAALYDIATNSYVYTCPMSYQQACQVMEILDGYDLNYFTNVVMDDLLIIYYQKLENEAEIKVYEATSQSPYRNYVNRELPANEPVMFFTAIEKTNKIQLVYKALQEQPWINDFRVIYIPSVKCPGYSRLKVYHKDASPENMLNRLKGMLDLEQAITFGGLKGKCDVLIRNSDGNIMVRKLKKLYEPVGFGKESP